MKSTYIYVFQMLLKDKLTKSSLIW